MVLTGWSIPIGVVIVVLVTLWLNKAIRDNETRNKCATCKDLRTETNKLVQCVRCGEWFCEDGAEYMTEAKNRSGKSSIVVSHSKKSANYPCGTKKLTTYLDKDKTEELLCTKHSPRLPSSYTADI